MTGQPQGKSVATLAGIAVFAVVVVWFGIVKAGRAPDLAAAGSAGTDARVVKTAESSAEPAKSGEAKRQEAPAPGQGDTQDPNGPKMVAPSAAASRPSGTGAVERPASEPPAADKGVRSPAQVGVKISPAAPNPPTGAAEAPSAAPSFDIVRVEPSGESVIAGRGAAGATVEMVRNGRLFARAVADTSGLFALVPPPLPPGTHDIALQTIAPDGTRAQSRESVTVVVSPQRDQRPLVAMTSPDRPTVVLSTPGPAAKSDSVAQDETAAAAITAAPLPAPGAPAPDKPRPPRPEVKVVSVEAEDGGRLFVSGAAAVGASVRLYLNDTLVAPGSAGGDGKVAFAIGRGVRPGTYKVRLDDVDPVSGDVKSRAEVAFAMPAPLNIALPPPAEAPVTRPSAAVPNASAPSASAPSAPAPLASAAPSGAPSPRTNAQAQQRQAAAAAPPAVQAPVPAPSAALPRSESPADARPLVGTPAPGAGAKVASAEPTIVPALPAAAEARSTGMHDTDPGVVVIPEINTAIVSRGDTLWRISRRIYGKGLRYTVIYGANQEQIRSPRLIYPGQVFVLPGGESAQRASN